MQYFREVRAGLIKDLGGEANVSTAQMVLVDRIIFKIGFLRLIEIWIAEKGSPFATDGQRLEPVIEIYLSYANSLRNDLNLLGIQKKDFPEVIDLKTYITEKYGQKSAEKRAEKAQDGRSRADEYFESAGNEPESQEPARGRTGEDHE